LGPIAEPCQVRRRTYHRGNAGARPCRLPRAAVLHRSGRAAWRFSGPLRYRASRERLELDRNGSRHPGRVGDGDGTRARHRHGARGRDRMDGRRQAPTAVRHRSRRGAFGRRRNGVLARRRHGGCRARTDRHGDGKPHELPPGRPGRKAACHSEADSRRSACAAVGGDDRRANGTRAARHRHGSRSPFLPSCSGCFRHHAWQVKAKIRTLSTESRRLRRLLDR
jgi:hypothetical protein